MKVTNEFLDHYLRNVPNSSIAAPDPRYATIERRLAHS
jgi:hypothetical protein